MIVMQETTVWADNTPNHIYMLSDDKSSMLGYINALTGQETMFAAKRRFVTKGRTFKLIRKVQDV